MENTNLPEGPGKNELGAQAEELVTGMGFSLIDMADFLEKIKGVLPKIKGFLPMAQQWENTLPKKPGEIIVYTAIGRINHEDANKNTVIVYVNSARELGQEITLADGTVLPADTMIITEQHKRFDLGELADNMLSYIPG